MAGKINENGKGSFRQLGPHKWECVIQSKYPNPDTYKPKRIKKRGATKEEAYDNARRALDVFEKAYVEKTEYRTGKTMTFGNYVFDYINVYRMMENPIKESTRLQYNRDYKCYIQPYAISNKQVQSLSKRAFQDYYDRLTDKYAEKTIKGAVVLCGVTCDWLVERKILAENYAKQAEVRVEINDEFKHVSKKTYKEILSLDDIAKILEAYENRLDSEYVYVTLFILETGIRPNEFQALTNDNFDWENRMITVEKALSTRIKEGFEITENTKTIPTEKYLAYPKQNRQSVEPRYVPMSTFCVEISKKMMLKVQEKCQHNPNNYFYPVFRTGKPRSLSTMEVGFVALMNKLNIDRDVHPVREGAAHTNIVGINLKNLRKTRETLMQTFSSANPISAFMQEYNAYTQGHSLDTSKRYYTKPTKEILSKLPVPPSPVDIVEGREFGLTEEQERDLYERLKAKFEVNKDNE